MIKGWLEEGEPREQVFDIACSDSLTVDPATHRCPDNGNGDLEIARLPP